MIRFVCQSYQTILQFADDQAGMHVSCPQCQLVMPVPRPAAAA
jgi:hypothetical protein